MQHPVDLEEEEEMLKSYLIMDVYKRIQDI